ncbi:MAG: nucleoside 2-deoxyribosyltransferase domain-containing protein [Pseudomonadota bacterium]|nr:nucleoside 2-deoxyribosyltransferase domain-containing protein [Pseudomonadota bacterium]
MADSTAPSTNLLQGSRVYLSGPMDFVASREEEMKFGWRNRIGQFLRKAGVTVFDPWNKPQARGLHEYGREGVDTTGIRNQWVFEEGEEGAKRRAAVREHFWETLHIDLRMVDTSDFIVAYCPTNIYSVGTPHEIVVARQQYKPVLFVSPPVTFPALDKLRAHLADDAEGAELLKQLEQQVPIKENPRGIPSLWYTTLVGGESFFDGFGFSEYAESFGWERSPLDELEAVYQPKRPLLRFLESVKTELPKKWSSSRNAFVRNDDWLLWDIPAVAATVEEPQTRVG